MINFSNNVYFQITILMPLPRSALVKKEAVKTHAEVTLVDHSSVPRMVNPFLSVSLHGVMVRLQVLKVFAKQIFKVVPVPIVQAFGLQSMPKESTDGLSPIWETMELMFNLIRNTVHVNKMSLHTNPIVINYNLQ